MRKKGTMVFVISCCLTFSGIMKAPCQAPDSLDIKIGQMILIGYPGTDVDSKVLDEVRKGKVGSIIIFEKNIPKANSFIALKKVIWTYQKAAPLPLFVAIDQEGGRVNRLKDKYGFPRSITAEAMGKATNLDSVRFYSESTAATLAGLGINVNFAPVVDLASNKANPIIAKPGRAFSGNADSVALMAKEVIVAHRAMGVVTVLKHFPGHGSSKDDTHLGIADVTNTWEQRELYPYRKLLDGGYVDAIMSAHIVNRKLDASGNPGTLSTAILDGILRKQMGYSGVVFSDDMQMHAIAKYYGLEEAIKLAIKAGIDIMIFSNNIVGSEERTVDRVHKIVRQLVQSGQISQERIDQSFRRIMGLKRKMTVPQADYYLGEIVKYKMELEKQKEKQELLRRSAEEAEKEAKRKCEEELRKNNETGKKKRKK